MCNQYHSLYREYRIREVDISGETEYHLEYYYNPFPISDEYVLKIKLWIYFFKTKDKQQAIDICKLYQMYADRHLKDSI